MHDDSRVHVTRPTTGHQRGRRVARSEPSRQPGARIHVSRHERDSQRTPALPPAALNPLPDILAPRCKANRIAQRESKEQNISPMSGNSSHEACRVVSCRVVATNTRIHPRRVFAVGFLSLSFLSPSRSGSSQFPDAIKQISKISPWM